MHTLTVVFDEVAYRSNGSVTVNVPFLEEGAGYGVVGEYRHQVYDRYLAACFAKLLTNDSQSTRMTLITCIGARSLRSGPVISVFCSNLLDRWTAALARDQEVVDVHSFVCLAALTCIQNCRMTRGMHTSSCVLDHKINNSKEGCERLTHG